MAEEESNADEHGANEDADKLVEEAMAQAQAAVNEINGVVDSSSTPSQADADAEAAMLAMLGQTEDGGDAGEENGGAGGGLAAALEGTGIEMLGDVELEVTVELGRTSMLVEDVLRLEEGSVIELDKLAGDPVDVFVNDRLVARGEVLVLNDNFCIRISEIVADLEEQAAAAARQEVAAV